MNKAVPSDMNIIQKERENKLKYKNLSTKIHRMCNVKYFDITITFGVTGTVIKNLKNT
jgi:hypothetical protein